MTVISARIVPRVMTSVRYLRAAGDTGLQSLPYRSPVTGTLYSAAILFLSGSSLRYYRSVVFAWAGSSLSFAIR